MSSAIIPALVYEDAPAAISWLEQAFGFERHLVVEGDGGSIEHAQLRFGTGMVMLGGARGTEYQQEVTTVRDAGKATAGLYVVVDDVDAHAAVARRAGAEFVLEPKDEAYGGRSYTCRDLEDNVWSFGDYDPWEPPPPS